MTFNSIKKLFNPLLLHNCLVLSLIFRMAYFTTNTTCSLELFCELCPFSFHTISSKNVLKIILLFIALMIIIIDLECSLILSNCCFFVDSSYCWPVDKRLLTNIPSYNHYVLILFAWNGRRRIIMLNEWGMHQPQEMKRNGKLKRCTVSRNRKRILFRSH